MPQNLVTFGRAIHQPSDRQAADCILAIVGLKRFDNGWPLHQAHDERRRVIGHFDFRNRSEEEQGGATAGRGGCDAITPHVLPLHQPDEARFQQVAWGSFRGAEHGRNQRSFLTLHLDK